MGIGLINPAASYARHIGDHQYVYCESMLKSPLYSNELALSAHSKAIPSVVTPSVSDGAASQSENHVASPNNNPDSKNSSDINYGFKNLKIKPSLIDTIPELNDDASLKALVTTLNARKSCFFTTSCSSKLSQTAEGYRRQGYVELAWNCTQCVQDAINYFALYFHFNKSLLVQGFNQPVQLKWIIEEASFSAVEVHGFSCFVCVRTRSLSSAEQANQVWQLSLKVIQSYMETVETNQANPIYKPLSECSSEL